VVSEKEALSRFLKMGEVITSVEYYDDLHLYLPDRLILPGEVVKGLDSRTGETVDFSLPIPT
jgi:hypothetical protein